MKWFLSCLLFLLHFVSFSNDTLVLDSLNQQVNLQNYCLHFEDTTNGLTINQIEHVNWKRLDGGLTFPINNHYQWFKYHLKNPYNKPIQKVVFIPYHLISKITIYSIENSKFKTLSNLGIHYPNNQKWLKSRGYSTLIKLDPKSSIDVIIRMDYLYRPLRGATFLMSEARTHEVIRNNNMLIWIWRGVFLFALIISLVFYYFVRLKLFLYYFILNIGVSLFIGSQIGDFFFIFNTDPSNFTSVIDFTGTILINLFLPQFLNCLTPIKANNRTLWKWMYRFIYLGVFVVFANLIPTIRNSELMIYSHAYILILTAFVFFIQLKFMLRNILLKEKNALITFSIYIIYITAAFSDAILPNLAIVEDSPFIFKVLILSSFFEIISFMILMGKETITTYKERAFLLYQQKHHQKELISSMVIAQEEERNRLGIELHDSIGANMAIIKHKTNKDNTDLYKIIEQTITDIRVLSHGLVTKFKKEDDFSDEIKDMCDLFTTNSLQFHPIFHNWPEIKDINLLTQMFRINQELFQNAIKHSEAKNVHLQFIGHENSSLSIVYEDDGIGFDQDEFHKGLGLNNIKKRVELINGSIQIDSNPNGKGTSIIIEVQLA